MVMLRRRSLVSLLFSSLVASYMVLACGDETGGQNEGTGGDGSGGDADGSGGRGSGGDEGTGGAAGSAASCANEEKDDDEADVDCGGSCDAPCDDGSACNSGADCVSGVCEVEGAGGMGGAGGAGSAPGGATRCLPARCGDGVVNGDESCDDGNAETEVCDYDQESCSVCSSACEMVAGAISYCGDGVVQVAGDEQCDDEELPTETCTIECESTVLVPGLIEPVATEGGWSVRCSSWEDDVCTHLEVRMSCDVCGEYAECGEWHSVTTFNTHEDRGARNFCAIATGNESVASSGVGDATLDGLAACAWSSATDHPFCEATKATYVASAVTNKSYGLNLDPGYCATVTSLLAVECVGW